MEVKAKKHKSVQDNWQLTHMEYYEAQGVHWPPAMDGKKWAGCSSLSQREFEIAFLADHLFPHARQCHKDVWNLDVNDDIKKELWSINGRRHFEESLAISDLHDVGGQQCNHQHLDA